MKEGISIANKSTMASLVNSATDTKSTANTQSPGIINNTENAARTTKSRSDSNGGSSPPGTVTPSNTPQQAMTPQGHRATSVASTSDANNDGSLSGIPPALVSQRLSQLAKENGDYDDNDADIEDDEDGLPRGAKAIVDTLREMDMEVAEALANYENERKQLESKYNEQLRKLYDQRLNVLHGREANTELKVSSQGVDAYAVEGVTKKKQTLPGFWRVAMENSSLLREAIAKHDVECLDYLVDIRHRILPSQSGDDDPQKVGFAIDFIFDSSNNPYFSNSILTKEYIILNMFDSTISEPVLKLINGTEIKWHDGKDLTHKLVKQRKKGTSETRMVLKPRVSFFNFFDAPHMDDIESEEEYNERCEIFDLDLEMALIIREKIIPRAIRNFTGEEQSSGEEDESDEEDDDDYLPGEENSESDDDDDTDDINLDEELGKLELANS